MSTISNEKKRIVKMHRSYNAAREQIKAAMAVCSVGTNTHLAHIKALADLDAKERDEEIKLGLVSPQMGKLTKTEFIFVCFAPSVPATRAELAELLNKQTLKACEKLYISEADEAIRAGFEERYK